MPKSVQGRAKTLIHEMYLSPTRKAAQQAYDQFVASYRMSALGRHSKPFICRAVYRASRSIGGLGILSWS
jgi:hypothetical protein